MMQVLVILLGPQCSRISRTILTNIMISKEDTLGVNNMLIPAMNKYNNSTPIN